MKSLLAVASLIDWLNDRLGVFAKWAVTLACVISAGNAFIRYGLDISSNAWLELQWYLFGAVVLLGAAYTLKQNEHIRIDIVTANVSRNVRNWIDVIGHALFLIPLCLLLLWLGVPFFMRSFLSGEVSSSAGGLIVWPAKLLVPLGFALLLAQGLSELIKRIAFMRGLIEDPTPRPGGAHEATE